MSAGRSVNSKSKHWGTPHKYEKLIMNFFNGTLELDPCSNIYSIINSNVKYTLPENDGLMCEWNFKSIFVNPPYGSDRERGTTIKDWMCKCSEFNKKYGSEILALIPVAPNTRHWKDHIFGHANSICFLHDSRLKFLENGKLGGKGAPMACCIVYWGKRTEYFFDLFINVGNVVNIEKLQK